MRTTLRECGRIVAWLLFVFVILNLSVDIHMYLVGPELWDAATRIGKWVLEGLCLYGWWKLK